MRIRLFGPVAVERAAGGLSGSALGPARVRLLLAFLATARGSVVTRDTLIGRLWEQEPPSDPSRALSTLVSRLRSALGPDASAIRSAGDGYQLECDTDLDELDRRVAAGAFDDAVRLLACGYLRGEATTEWVEARRDEFARWRIDLLVQSGRSLLSAGDHDRASARFAEAIAGEPLREDGHRGLMEALAQSGRNAEALRAYEHCRRVLRENLGVAPSAETQALYGGILGGPRRSRAPAPRLLPGDGELPFLGRRDELEMLVSLLGDPGRVLLAVVAGEPGIGKSRLVREALARRLPAGRPLEAKCSSLMASVPFALVEELTEQAGFPSRVLATRPLEWAVDLADRLSSRLPLVVFVDDLQWADPSSLQLLGVLVRRLAGKRLTVVVTLREEELTGDHPTRLFLELARRRSSTRTITLGPLRPADLEEGGFGAADWERTGGHPLLLVEQARGASTAELATIIAERIARLGPTATGTMAAAATLDRPATLEELAALTEGPGPEVRLAAARLAAEALLREQGGAWPVRHDVIAELVRAALDDRVRRRLHRRALDSLTDVSPAELARHALGAGEWARAFDLALAAGEVALAAFADHEALTHFRSAMRLAAEHGAGDEGGRVRAARGCVQALLVQGKGTEASVVLAALPPAAQGRPEFERLALTSRAAWVAWQPSAAIVPARRALDVARGLGDDELMGEAHALLANPYGSLGEFELALEHIGHARAIFERVGREPPALLWFRVAIIEHYRGQEHETLVTLARLRTAALAEHDETGLVMECLLRSWALGGLGRYGEALAALDDVSRIGKGEEAFARARVPNTRGWLFFDLGLYEQALDADEESLEVALHNPDVGPEPTIQTLLNLAQDHLALGHPDAAARHLVEAEHLADGAEIARFRFLNRLEVLRGLLALEAGRPSDALTAAEAARTLAFRYDAPRNTARAELVSGLALARLGEVDAGIARFRAAVRVSQHHGFAALAEQAHRLAGQWSGSSHHLRRADRWRARITASAPPALLQRREARLLKHF